VLETDEKGRVKLSMKALLAARAQQARKSGRVRARQPLMPSPHRGGARAPSLPMPHAPP
jgi:hypothetical protein